MTGTTETENQPAQTSLSPFYILSTVVAAVICLGLAILAIRSYIARRRFQQRFFDLVQGGYVAPVFNIGDSNTHPLPHSHPIPELNEAVVLRARARRLANLAKWADSQPLVLTSIPKASSSTKTLINIFVGSNFSRNRRSSSNIQRAAGPISTPSAPQSSADGKGNPLPTLSAFKETVTPPPAPDTLQAVFLIAMPSRQADGAGSQLANLELHLGTAKAEWDRASCPIPRAVTPPPVLSSSQPSLQSILPPAQPSFPIFPHHVQGEASIPQSPLMSQVQLHRLPVQSRSTLTTERPTRDTSRNPSTTSFALNSNSEQPQS